jgi:hypothetical protein
MLGAGRRPHTDKDEADAHLSSHVNQRRRSGSQLSLQFFNAKFFILWECIQKK